MTALIAQVQTPSDGISSGMFTPLVFGTIIYVVLLLAATVLENRDDARGETLGNVSFVVLLLLGVYTAVLLISALAQQFELIVDMLEIMAIVVAFFAVIILVLFGLSLLFGLIGRLVGRRKRVTTT